MSETVYRINEAVGGHVSAPTDQSPFWLVELCWPPIGVPPPRLGETATFCAAVGCYDVVCRGEVCEISVEGYLDAWQIICLIRCSEAPVWEPINGAMI